jgi:hypothetical protein
MTSCMHRSADICMCVCTYHCSVHSQLPVKQCSICDAESVRLMASAVIQTAMHAISCNGPPLSL